jgi:hypothetical protein
MLVGDVTAPLGRAFLFIPVMRLSLGLVVIWMLAERCLAFRAQDARARTHVGPGLDLAALALKVLHDRILPYF